jgi:hypothetical protein
MSPAKRIAVVLGPYAEVAQKQQQAFNKKEKKFVKCFTCKDFFEPSDIGVSIFTDDCTACDHSRSYCEGCGGQTRATRSILLHCAFYMREKSLDWYGEQHASSWQSYSQAKVKDRMKIMNGGKK